MKILCALILAVWSLYGGEAWGQFSVTEISILKSLTNRDCVNNESPVWVFATQRWSCGPTGGVGDVTEVQGTSPISVSSGTGPVPVVSITANGLGPTQIDETANYEFTGTVFDNVALASLPAAGTSGRFIWVNDCESLTACSTGLSSNWILHYDDGANWLPRINSEVDTPQSVFNRIANGDVAVSGVTETKPWKFRGAAGGATYGFDIFVDSTNVPQIMPVFAGVQNDGDRTLNIPTGKVFDFQINSVSVGKLTGAGVENLTLSAEGTGNVVTIPRRLWFPFAACQNATASLIWDSPTSNAPPAACVTGTNTQKGVADFDATTDESLQMTYMLPSTFSGAIDAKIVGLAAATSGAAGLCVQLVSTADAETDDPAFPAQGAGNCVSDTAKGTTLQLNTATITGVTATGVAAGELLHIRFSRDADGSAVTDDMTGDWRGVGLELTIRETL